MEELLRFLFIAIATLYIIKVIVRAVLPMLFQSVINKAQQGGPQQQRQQTYRATEKPTGKVKVDYVPEGKKSRVPDSEGEFIDYEEIK